MPAFRSSGALAAALLLSAAACTRTIQTFTPQGMVETQEAFLQYNATRTQKDIYPRSPTKFSRAATSAATGAGR